MTKPKLTDAVKQPSEKLPETAQAPAAAADSGTGGAAGLPPAAGKDKGSDDSGDDDEPEASAGAAGKPTDPPAPAKPAAASQEAHAASGANKTLAEYKAAFGNVQGCVYFAEGVEFSAACAKHIEAQGKQIADLKSANETLTNQTASLAKEVLGTAEPLKTGSETAKTGGKSQIDEYASLLESKLEKLK